MSAQEIKWRCFHCDAAFTEGEREEARAHFGASPIERAACQVSAADLREMQAELDRHREEDTDLHRRIHSLQCEHSQALVREEEKGYARGLADARKHPGELGLMRVDGAPLPDLVRATALTNSEVLALAPIAGEFNQDVADGFCGGFRRCAKHLLTLWPARQGETDGRVR